MSDIKQYLGRAKITNEPGILIPDRPIAFNRDFVGLGIGIKGALFLSQAVYWTRRTKDKDGWFYKTNEDWEEETGLTADEQRGIKKALSDRGFILVEKRGIPARNHFQVDLHVIADALIARQWRDNPMTGDGETPSQVAVDSRDIPYTENTQRSAAKAASPSFSVVSDSPSSRSHKKDTGVLRLRDKLYDMFEKEYGVYPTISMADYKRVQAALKHLTEKQVIDLVEDALEGGRPPKTVREALTDRAIDSYRYEHA